MKTLAAIVLLLIITPVLAGTLDDIKSSGELKLAYRADTPPFSSGARDAEPEGFTIDMCRIIARDIRESIGRPDMKVTWVEVTAENRFDAIATGSAHLGCSSTTVTLSRQEQVDFSNLTYVTGASLMRWGDEDIDRVDDLGGKRVSVVTGTTTEKVLRETLSAKDIDAKVVVVKNYAEALQLLVDHKIDAMAGDQATLFGIGYKTQGENNLVITEDMMSFEPYALPLRRNDADFRLAVNRSLSNLYMRGDVGRSWEKWFGRHDVRPTSLLLMLYRLNSFAE
ncbi:MAG: amino acid ABC transporter substrate-binding protein [Gammaproteobacteria bacterium]|nr:amino acid ABC transporter substrate-binding protein [Gammaproteobacteria bacterium]